MSIGGSLFHDEIVHADDDLFLSLDRLLILVRRILNFALRKSLLDRRDHSAHRVEPLEVFPAAFFHIERQALDEIRAAQRIDRVRDAAFVGDDLLRSQRDSRRVLGRQRQRFVQRVRVQRLRSAEHRGQRLDRDADDVVVRLLRRQRASGRLRVEAKDRPTSDSCT